MPSLTDYKGLDVVSPDPTGDGGLAIQNDFKSLVDWNPKSVWSQSADPTAGDDQGDNFYPGSMWLRTDTTPPKLFVCRSSALGAAVWTRIELTGDGVPYTGATANVNLGDYQLTTLGLRAGFSTSNPNIAASISNFWFPRIGDLTAGWMLDYLDEFAVRHLKGGTISVSPSPSLGIATSLLVDDSAYIAYSIGTSPGTVVIEIDTSANPVTNKGNPTYAVGLTYRSSNGAANPTHIKIEYQGPSTSYSTVYNASVSQVTGYGAWVSPLLTPPSPDVDISKVKITLTVTTPLPTNFRIQRVMLYHPTAAWDPWHLHVTGGTLYGALQVAGPIGTAVASKTSAYTLTASDSIALCDATGAAFTITLPTAAGVAGRQYTVKRVNGGSNNVTVATTSSQTIDGATTYVLSAQYDKITVTSDGANWFIL